MVIKPDPEDLPSSTVVEDSSPSPASSRDFRYVKLLVEKSLSASLASYFLRPVV